MTGHKCKLPDIRRSRRDQIWTCGCGKEYRPVRYTCRCGTFGCRDAWEWVGMVELPAQVGGNPVASGIEAAPTPAAAANPVEVEVEVEVEDDAAE